MYDGKCLSGHSNLKLTLTFGKYHGTTLVNLILTSCWCQIANIIWTSAHEANMMSRICLENDHCETNLMKKNVGWKIYFVQFLLLMSMYSYVSMCQFNTNSWRQFDVESWRHKNYHFWPMVDGQMMSNADLILMSFQHVLPTGVKPVPKNVSLRYVNETWLYSKNTL